MFNFKILLIIPLFVFFSEDKCSDHKYTLHFKDPMMMCPHLGPKIVAELDALSKCQLIEKNKKELFFYSERIVDYDLLDSLLIEKIGLPKWEIDTLISEK